MPKNALVVKELDAFMRDLNFNFQNLPCLAREPGEPRELLLVRKELATRDDQISRLEQQLQQREDARQTMAEAHDSLKRQLEDAKALVYKVEAVRAARLEAESKASAVLAGSPSAQQFLAKDLQELHETEDRAREARAEPFAQAADARDDDELSELPRASLSSSLSCSSPSSSPCCCAA